MGVSSAVRATSRRSVTARESACAIAANENNSMSIKATCHCGAQFMAQPALAGKTVKCPSCGQFFQVPRPSLPREFTVACTCGRVYPVKPELFGRQVRCQSCGCQFVVPTPGRPPVRQTDPLGSANPLDGLGDMSNWGMPTGVGSAMNMPLGNSTLPSTPYSYRASTTKRKSSFEVNKKLVALIGLSALTAVAIAAISVATFLWWRWGGRKYNSPEAVFAANKQATANKDWKTYFDTVTPESQAQMVGALVFALKMSGTIDPRITELLSKHGVINEPSPRPRTDDFTQLMAQMQEEIRKSGDSVKDKRAFFVDAMSQIELQGERMKKQMGIQAGALEDAGANSTLKDVVVEGDFARGTQSIAINGRTFDLPISFRKIDGGWRIDMTSLGGVQAAGDRSNPLMPGPTQK